LHKVLAVVSTSKHTHALINKV